MTKQININKNWNVDNFFMTERNNDKFVTGFYCVETN